MNTRVLVGLAVAGVVVLASCSQDREATPLLPTQASFIKPSSGSCVAQSTTNNNAKAYFASAQDPVFALIDSEYKYRGLAQTDSTNKYGYAALSRLAQAANSPTTLVKGDSVQGSTVAKNLLGCMTVSGYADSISFVRAFGKTGLFAVRSDAVTDPAVSRSITANVGPLFGAERADSVPAIGTAAAIQYQGWHARLGTQAYTGPILFYGYKLPDSVTFNGETSAGTIFDISSLPASLSFINTVPNSLNSALSDTLPTLRAGLCDMPQGSQILHEHDGASILAQTGAPLFCSLTAPPAVGLVQSPFSMFAAATKRMASWFAPQPLYAFIAFGGSGSYGGLSRGGPVTYDIQASGVTWYQAPKRIRLGAQPQSPPISVQVVSSNGTAVEGVKVALSVIGNFGSFTPPADSVRQTSANGRATFKSFYLDKSGSYNITATASRGGTTFGSVTATINVTGN